VSAASLRLGTRGSRLALLQSGLVAAALRSLGADVELVTLVTSGDVRRPDTAWGEGAFVGALERALLDGSIDLAVHSAKDVPIEPEDDLLIAAYPARADAGDALVVRDGLPARTLADLPAGAVIGTDSPRRSGFVLARRPGLTVVGLSGNVDTRLAKLDRGDADALVLAVAGLTRLGRADRITERLPADLVPPAPGQGALAVQVRADRRDIVARVAQLDDAATRTAVQAEREVLRLSGGGCRAPLGAFAEVRGDVLRVTAGVVDPSGSGRRVITREAPVADGLALAAAVADELLPDRRWPAPPSRARGTETPA
jgi:hydroxymethylbilane synthase